MVLGVGVAMLLRAAVGSDGISTFINGVALSAGVNFFWANLVISVVMIGLARARGVRLGIGSVVQPVVVGLSVSSGLAVLSEPASLPGRTLLLVAALPVVAVGLAGYLACHAGTGPAEAVALAFDPPVPFRWSYSALQSAGALVGWLLGAAVGPGTLAVVVLLGPMADLLLRRVPLLQLPATTPNSTSPGSQAPTVSPPDLLLDPDVGCRQS